MRRRTLLLAMWITAAAVVCLFDWGVAREGRTTYATDVDRLGRPQTAPSPGG